MQKRVIVSVINDIATDQRVKRTAFTLQQKGYEVVIVGRQWKDSLEVSYPGMTIRRFRFAVNHGFIFYALFQVRLFLYLLFTHADLFFSNDLDTLLPNFLVSKIKSIPLVYDTHEYFTGVPELENRPWVKGVWRWVERRIFPHLKHTITVNNSIAALYYQDYGVKPTVVRNVPMVRDVNTIIRSDLRSRYHLSPDKKIIILQGSGINIHRGAEEAVLAMKEVEQAVLLLIGSGDVFPLIPALVRKHNLEGKVILHPKVLPDELPGITAACFAGLTLDKDTNINYRYSLPNKLFDYLQAGIPVIASDLVEVRAIVEDYKVGLITRSPESHSIAECILELIDNPPLYQELKANASRAAGELCWEKEKDKLISVIDHSFLM